MNQNINIVYKFCKRYYRKYKKFPKIIKIINGTKLPYDKIKSILHHLVLKNLIKKSYNYYYFPEQEKVKQKTQNKEIDILNIIFKVIIFLVFVNFCYIGIKYNYYGNKLTGKDEIDAITCAIAFFSICIVFLKMFVDTLIKKNPICILFGILYILLFGYNFTTILQYQYNRYQDKIVFSDNKIQSQKDKNKNNKLEDSISILKKDLQSKNDERDRIQNILKDMNKNDKEYGFYYWQIYGKTGLNNKIDNLINQINLKSDEQTKLIENSEIIVNEKKPLLSGFLMSLYLLLPSFIIELLASISLILLLKKNN